MGTIRKGYPIGCTYVNESQGFAFDCLPKGMYAFVIPTASYNGFVGSPLPYEFDCPNVSIKIAFQGGVFTTVAGIVKVEADLTARHVISPTPIKSIVYLRISLEHEGIEWTVAAEYG